MASISGTKKAFAFLLATTMRFITRNTIMMEVSLVSFN